MEVEEFECGTCLEDDDNIEGINTPIGQVEVFKLQFLESTKG